MSIRKPSIPTVPKSSEPRAGFDAALKETLETITGRRGQKIKLLADDATLPQVVAKVNELLGLLQ